MLINPCFWKNLSPLNEPNILTYFHCTSTYIEPCSGTSTNFQTLFSVQACNFKNICIHLTSTRLQQTLRGQDLRIQHFCGSQNLFWFSCSLRSLHCSESFFSCILLLVAVAFNIFICFNLSNFPHKILNFRHHNYLIFF